MSIFLAVELENEQKGKMLIAHENFEIRVVFQRLQKAIKLIKVDMKYLNF